jgi:hypothetical protein
LVFLFTYKVLANDYHNEKSFDLKCNPNNNNLAERKDFLIRQWLSARSELDLKDYNKINYYNGQHKYKENEAQLLKYINRFKHRIESFYSETSPNGVVVYYCNKSTISYARILKCSSEGIKANLELICSNISNSNSIKNNGDKNAQKQKFVTIEYNTQSKLGIAFGRDFFPVFTFVRDPFEHFISGFVESVWGTYGNVKELDGSPKKLNVSFVKSLLDDLLLFNYTKLWPLDGFKHLFPMTNIFFKFHINIIGQLESFEDDWNHKIRPVYNISQPYVKSFGQHPTSVNHPFAEEEKRKNNNSQINMPKNSDPNNARTALLELFREDVRYKRMVCQLLLLDYVCLPMYSLPKECEFLDNTVKEVRNSMKNS